MLNLSDQSYYMFVIASKYFSVGNFLNLQMCSGLNHKAAPFYLAGENLTLCFKCWRKEVLEVLHCFHNIAYESLDLCNFSFVVRGSSIDHILMYLSIMLLNLYGIQSQLIEELVQISVLTLQSSMMSPVFQLAFPFKTSSLQGVYHLNVLIKRLIFFSHLEKYSQPWIW